MTSTREEAISDTFSGVVTVKTTTSGGRRIETYRSYFPRVFREVVDVEPGTEVWAFDEVPKLGPSILFRRTLTHVADPSEYFGNNDAVKKDTEQRARLEADPKFQWPETSEQIKGFHDVYPPEYLRRIYGPEDPVWENAAARGWKWITARALVVEDDALVEVLVWLPGPANLTDESRANELRGFLDEADLHLVESFFEFYDSHLLLPSDSMIIFSNLQRSN